jgi:hypothetical protein
MGAFGHLHYRQGNRAALGAAQYHRVETGVQQAAMPGNATGGKRQPRACRVALGAQLMRFRPLRAKPWGGPAAKHASGHFCATVKLWYYAGERLLGRGRARMRSACECRAPAMAAASHMARIRCNPGRWSQAKGRPTHLASCTRRPAWSRWPGQCWRSASSRDDSGRRERSRVPSRQHGVDPLGAPPVHRSGRALLLQAVGGPRSKSGGKTFDGCEGRGCPQAVHTVVPR